MIEHDHNALTHAVVIPARGGSKGIPSKNLMLYRGEPLVVRAIKTAIASDAQEVVVSSDDEEILQLALDHGAQISRRPASLSGDWAGVEDAVRHALVHQWEYADLPDAVVVQQCTSPATTRQDINAVLHLLETSDTVVSVTPCHVYLWGPDERPINFNASVPRMPRQLAPPQYRETGALYGMRTQGLLTRAHRFFGRTRLYIHDPDRDIDTPADARPGVVCRKCGQVCTTTVSHELGVAHHCSGCGAWTDLDKPTEQSA